MLQLCSGDNLSINGYMGFVESFTANYPCRFCKMKRSDFTSNIYDNSEIYRTIENYDNDVLQENVTGTGIKERCCFNKLLKSSGFHVTKNYVVDMSHDILEGVANYVMPRLLCHLIFKLQTCSVKEFNDLCAAYSFDHSSKPSYIKEEHINKGNDSRLNTMSKLKFKSYY